MSTSIHFFSEGIKFKLPQSRKTSTWIKGVISNENKILSRLNYVFCSDEYLRSINIQYLNHTTYTDVVTFDHSEIDDFIEGDIFISIDRVYENALKFNRPFQEELHRVIIHGVLHLIGYSDKGERNKALMRKKEEACLSLPTVPRETFV
ncbi:MAG TPA: rRNA maturation RNase YbeY [Ohtaekwangia sp.]|nr:rRNA maturation RNase YbeY [Ohtaekwangia sp.]